MFEVIPYKNNNRLMSRNSDDFSQLFNNFFNDDFSVPSNSIDGGFKVDLKENDNEYIIQADLPGVKKEAINIEYNNNYITISTKVDDSVEEKEDTYVRRERHFGEFKRSLYIDNIDADKIDASFSNGVLDVKLPKLNKDVVNKKKISIH